VSTVDNYKEDVAITTCSDGSYCCGHRSFDCCNTHQGYWIIDGVVTSSDPNNTSGPPTLSKSSSSSTSTSSSPSAVSSPVSFTLNASPTTISSSATSTYTLPATINTVSPVATPKILSCSDSSWEPNPRNWVDAAVESELASWWSKTASERGSRTFVDWISSSFGDNSRGQHCGIGTDSSCSAPDCQSKNLSMDSMVDILTQVA